MGASKQAGAGGDYYKIIAGSLRKKCDENHPEAVKREYEDDKKEKKVVFELEYGSWTGLITGLERVTTKKGDEIHIHMDDGTEKCVIRTQIDSGYGRDFMKRVLDGAFKFTEECTVSPVMIEETKAKKKYYFTVTQNGSKMKSPFTQESEKDPNSPWKLPPWVPVDLGAGKVAYNKDGEINKLWAWATAKAVKQDPMFKIVVREDNGPSSAAATPPPAAPPANVPVSYAAAPPPPPSVPHYPGYTWNGTAYVPDAPQTPPPPPAPAWQAPPVTPPPPVSSTASGYTPPTAEDDLPF